MTSVNIILIVKLCVEIRESNVYGRVSISVKRYILSAFTLRLERYTLLRSRVSRDVFDSLTPRASVS